MSVPSHSCHQIAVLYMAKSRWKTATKVAEHIPFVAFLWAMRLLPFNARIRAGGVLVGGLVAHLPKAKRRIRQNLRYIYPDISDAEIEHLTKGIGRNFGRTFTEIFFNDAYRKRQELFHASGPGFSALKAASESGKGAVLVSGHFGQWEAIRHYCAAQGIPVGAVYRPNTNVYFDRIFLRELKKAGAPIFPSGRKGTIDVLKFVQGGGVVAILTDQRVPNAPVYDFLDKGAETSTVAAKIALKHDVPLIPVYGTRRTDSLDVDIAFEAPIPPSDADTMTQAINDSLSARVRENREQWFWLHRRWGILDQE